MLAKCPAAAFLQGELKKNRGKKESQAKPARKPARTNRPLLRSSAQLLLLSERVFAAARARVSPEGCQLHKELQRPEVVNILLRLASVAKLSVPALNKWPTTIWLRVTRGMSLGQYGATAIHRLERLWLVFEIGGKERIEPGC